MREPSQRSTFSTDGFGKRIVLPMVTLVIVSIGLVLGFVVVAALEQNRLEVKSSTRLAQTAIDVNRRQMARNLRDYAVWEDVYNNLHKKVDVSWAATDGNVGANIYEGLGYQLAIVVNPQGKPVYSVLEGTPSSGLVDHLNSQELFELIELARESVDPKTGLLRLNGEIFLVAAATIIPPYLDRADIGSNSLSVLVFAKRLDADWLNGIGEEYLLENPHIVPGAVGKLPDAAIPLATPRGSVLAYMSWLPETPGYELLRSLFLPLTGATVAMCIFAFLALRNAHRSTEALEDSAKTVQTYADTLKESEARFRDVAEASSDWIWECDEELRFTYISTRFAEVTGIAPAAQLGRTAQSFFAANGREDECSDLLVAFEKKKTFRDVRCLYCDSLQEVRVCRLAGRAVFDSNSEFQGYRGTATDITEEVEAQARANYLALHDGLTGLPNRILFRQRLDDQLELHDPKSERKAILCIDLDHFKEVNDMLGHAVGDALLIEVGNRIRTYLSPSDTIARLGGDEFAIILANAGSSDDVAALSLRIIAGIEQPFKLEGHDVHIGASVGIALPETTPGEGADSLLKSADLALYRAKNAGRGTVRFFEREMDIELQKRKTLEGELRLALGRDELEVHFQPILSLQSQKIVGAEALLRWNHPEFGSVSPEMFIPIAEKCGLIGEISQWVLRTACVQALQWNDLNIAVNISPVHFRRPDLVPSIRQIIRDTRLPPNRLELEVTESVLIKDTEAALNILTELKSMGVQLAMDDFGTGYSSLAYLNAFPFDKLKVDRSFVSGQRNLEKSQTIVRSIVSLGRRLQMVVTAEGIETEEQLRFLVDEGCEQGQGFHFSKAVPATEFNALIERWNNATSEARSSSVA